ncbi:hypothetical protein DPMN_020459 [Dreissena polymorpha]|uniref:Uncharacterized protein n=1 Tax=Dreissena polymorpha TaxID=45954 RepID=A0A9D4NMK1_DREPO|nr:hypothetical protein DPMN_020459 [Dreissena polymorpha]
MLKFATPVYVTKVDVYETFNAGGVKEIGCFDFQEEIWPNGTMVVNRRWIWLWSTPQVSVINSARIFSSSFEVKERTELGLVSSNFFTELNTQLFAWTIRRPLTLDITMLMCYVALYGFCGIFHNG